MADIKELAKLSYDRALAQKNLEEKQLSRLLLAHAGGLWKVDPTLINLLVCYKDEPEIVLLDSSNIPRRINPAELLDMAKKRHQEVLNDWQIEYSKLARIRTVNHVLE